MGSSPRRAILLALALICSLFGHAYSQGARPNGAGTEILDAVNPGDAEFRSRQREKCNNPFREVDGTCTSFPFRLWGSAGRPQFSYMHRRSCERPVGQDLPSARLISNVVCAQPGNRFNRRNLNEYVTFFGQFLDHCFATTPSNVNEKMPIKIPRDDPIFGNFTNGELEFSRSRRGTLSATNRLQLPINSLSSAIDLAAVYGSNEERLASLRESKDGLMKTSGKNMMPRNTGGLVNAPTKSAAFFIAGDHRSNENPALAAVHTIFLREHNRIARELKKVFPTHDDEKLFQYAKSVNTAQFQKIVFEEFYPLMTGKRMPRYTGYKSWIDPTLSDVFAGAAFRIGHTMVSDKMSRRGPGMRKLPNMPVQQMFFRPASFIDQNGIEMFIRGAVFEKGQEVDPFVVDALRNFLFTNVPEEKGFDLIALNIQRGRDHCLPTFNQVRRIVFDRPARRWAHITRNRAVQNALHTVYKRPDRVEAFIGLISEDHAPGASMGRTMQRLWKKEFERLMFGDRFYFRNYEMYPQELWDRYEPLRAMMNENEVMKRIIIQNSAITAAEIPGSIWRSKA